VGLGLRHLSALRLERGVGLAHPRAEIGGSSATTNSPRRTRSPRLCFTFTTRPLASARTVARRSAMTSPAVDDETSSRTVA